MISLETEKASAHKTRFFRAMSLVKSLVKISFLQDQLLRGKVRRDRQRVSDVGN